ncbi:MAG: cation:proton antiporter [Acidimicrobiia bacterium]
MEESIGIAVVAAFVVSYAAVSARLSRTWLTGPIVFVTFGYLVGPDVLDVVPLGLESELVRILAELTLVLVLFTDAARIHLRELRRESSLPIRLLVIGMPLTIAGGAAVAYGLFDVAPWSALLLAAVLTPTDAALGQVVVASPRVPGRIRQTLNVESGLNDGIAVPFITLFIAGASATQSVESADFWVRFATKQIGFGVLVGIGIGLVGGWLVDRATESGWMDGTFRQLAVLSLAVGAFFTAEEIDGNGFIAAFVAGLVVGNVTRDVCSGIFDFTEEEGQLLALITFMIFGGAFVGPTLGELTWQVALYAVLSLTLIRMVPVALALAGAGLRRDTVAFVGWFGPRGLASIVFGLLVLESADVPAHEEIFTVVTWTVLASVFAHGLSAVPLSDLYGRRVEAAAEEPGMAEMEPTVHHRLRWVPHHLRGDDESI